MRKLRFLFALPLVVSLILPVSASLKNGSLSNFKKIATYSQGQFLDVPSTAWFAPYVKEAYEYGALSGVSETSFNPNGNLKISEAITIACWLNTTYYYGDNAINQYNFSLNNFWYQPFVDYAKKNGIIDNRYDQVYENEATRADFAMMIIASFPKGTFQNMKNIPDGSIPDVPVGSPYYDSVYSLYRAGIISGSDTKGSFNPLTGITRGEISVILSNIINLNRSSEVPIKNINTLSDLEYYLNQNMSSCVTPLGTYNYKFTVRERALANDFIIETSHLNGYPWYELQYSNYISSAVKEDTLSTLREFQRKVYQIANSEFPDAAISGGFCDRGYKYPNIKVDPYVVTALSWSNHKTSGNDDNYSFYWDTSRDSYDFNSNEENTDIETDISTIRGLENYLNANFSTCKTPMGEYTLKFTVSENTYSFNGWDIEILTETPYSVLPWVEIDNSIEYTNEEKNETLAILKDIQEDVYEIANAAFPDKKLTGCYFSDWYKYPNLDVGYNTSRHLSWKNYDSDGYAKDYDSTYRTSFHWDSSQDD